jgi:hypothetical protein
MATKRSEGVVGLEEVRRRVSAGLVALLSQLPGFVAYYCAESDNDVLVTTSVFESQAGSEESERREQVWARENLGFLVPNPPQVTEEDTATGTR